MIRKQDAAVLQVGVESMLLDKYQLGKLLHITEATVRKMAGSDPTFPKSIRLHGSSSAPALWRLEDVKRWLDGKFEEAR